MVKSIFDAIIPVDTKQEQEQEQVQELGQELGQEQVQATQGASIFDSIIPVASAAEEPPVVNQNELQQDQTDPEQPQLTAQGRENAEAYVAQQIANALASKREGEEPTTIDKYSAANKKGVEAANLGWDLIANMAEEYFTRDTKNTEEILANQVNEYLQLQSDPRVIEAMDLTTKEYEASGGGIKGGYEGLKLMLGYFIDNPEAAGLFLAEQIPPLLITSPLGGTPGVAAKGLARTAGVSKVKQRAIQTAVTGAGINTTAVVGNALGPNYAEGLNKFNGDTEKAREYATIKTLNEIPANAIAGLFLGVNPVTRLVPGAPKLAQVTGDVATAAVIQGVGGGVGAKQAAESVGEDITFGELGLEIIGGTFTTPVDIVAELATRPSDQGVDAISQDRSSILTAEEDQQILSALETPTQPITQPTDETTTVDRRRVFPPTGTRARNTVFPPTGEEATSTAPTMPTTPEGQIEFDFGPEQGELFTGADPNIETEATDTKTDVEADLPPLPNPDQLQLDFNRPLTDKLAEGIINQTSKLVEERSPLEAETIYNRAIELVDAGDNPSVAFPKAIKEFNSGKIKVDADVNTAKQMELPLPKRKGRPSTVDKRAKDIEKTAAKLEKKAAIPLPAVIRSRNLLTKQGEFDFVLRELEKPTIDRNKEATLDEVQSSVERKLKPVELRKIMDESFKLLGQYQDAEAFSIYQKARDLINEGSTPAAAFKKAKEAYKKGQLEVTRGEPKQLELALRQKRKRDKQPERPRSTLLAPEQLALDLDKPEQQRAPQQLEMPLRQRRVKFAPGMPDFAQKTPAVTRKKKKEPVSIPQARKTAEKVASAKKKFQDVDVLEDTPEWINVVNDLLDANTEVSKQTADILGDPSITNGSLIRRLIMAPVTKTVEEFARRRGLGNYVDRVNKILANAAEKTSKMRYKADLLAQQMSAFMFDNPVAAEKFSELISLAADNQFDVAKYKNYAEAVQKDKILIELNQDLKNENTTPERAAEIQESINNRKAVIRELYTLWNALGNLKRRPSIFFPRGAFRRNDIPEGHELFIKLRDMYKNMLAEQRRVDLANIEKLGVNEETKAVIRQAIFTKFAQLQEADFYSPNMRFGKRYVRVSEGDQVGFYTFDNELLAQVTPGVVDDRQKFINGVIAELQAKGDKRTAEEIIAEEVVTFGDNLEELRKDLGGQDSTFSEVFNILDKVSREEGDLNTKEIIESLQESITQAYLDGLPSVDMRKRMMRRRNVKGYDKDPLRAFSVYMQHASSQIPRREFTPDLKIAYSEAMENFGRGRPDAEVLKAYIDELNERASIALTPENVPELLRTVENVGAGSVFYVSLTAASSAIQNLFTLPILGLTVFGNKYGYGRTLAKFTNYLTLFGAGNGDLLPDGFDPSSLNIEQDKDAVPLFLSIRNSPFVKNDPIRRAAMDVAINREVIQQNFFSELTATTNVASTDRLSGRFRSIVPRIKMGTEASLKAIAFPFKMTEKLVREIMFISAFDFEFEANFPQLTEKYIKELRPDENGVISKEAIDKAEQRAYDDAFNMSVDKAINVLNEGAFNYSRHNRAANRLMGKGDVAGAAVRNATRLQSYRIQFYDFMARNTLLAFKEGVQFQGQDKGSRRRDAFSKLLVSMGLTTFMGGIRATVLFSPILAAVGAALNGMDWAKEILDIDEEDEEPSSRKHTNVIYRHSFEQWFSHYAMPNLFAPDKQYVQNLTAELNKLRSKDNPLTATQVSEFLRLSVMRGVPGTVTGFDISPQVDMNLGNVFNNPYERGGGKIIDPNAFLGVAGDIAKKVKEAVASAYQAATEERDFGKAISQLGDGLSNIPAPLRNANRVKELQEKGRVDRFGTVIVRPEDVTPKEKVGAFIGYGMTSDKEDAINNLKNQRVLEKLIDERNAILADVEENYERLLIGKNLNALNSIAKTRDRIIEFNRDVLENPGVEITDEAIDKKIETILENMQVNGMELYLPPTKGMSKAQRAVLERAQELNIGIRQE
jgi:DNA-binding Lrp family transcriptional regulator